jgi:hypothetical protein
MTAQDYFLHETPSTAYGRLRRRPALPPIRAEIGMVTCSRCLRVQRGSSWIEAEDVIRELRSYELAEAPRLRPGLCDRCRDILSARRTPAHSIAA